MRITARICAMTTRSSARTYCAGRPTLSRYAHARLIPKVRENPQPNHPSNHPPNHQGNRQENHQENHQPIHQGIRQKKARGRSDRSRRSRVVLRATCGHPPSASSTVRQLRRANHGDRLRAWRLAATRLRGWTVGPGS